MLDPLIRHLDRLLPLQEPLLLNPTLTNIHEKEQPRATNQTQREQEVKRTTIIPRIVDNRTADQRPNKRTRLTDDREQAEEEELLAPRRHLADHGLRVTVPRADEQAVEDLVQPDFPALVEPEGLRPDADHAPAVEEDNADGHGHEHGLGGEGEAFLDLPVGSNADGLRGDADDEEVCELQAVVGYDLVLQRADHSDSGVEAVAEEEVANEIGKTLAELPDLAHRVAKLLDAGEDDVGFAWVLAWAPFLEDKPWDGAEYPYAGCKGNEYGKTPIVVCNAVVDADAEHNTYDDGEDEDLKDGLHIKGCVGELIALHHIGEVVLCAGDSSFSELFGFDT